MLLLGPSRISRTASHSVLALMPDARGYAGLATAPEGLAHDAGHDAPLALVEMGFDRLEELL